MADQGAAVETAMKWGLILAVAGFGMYAAYKFMQTQGWIPLARVQAQATVRTDQYTMF